MKGDIVVGSVGVGMRMELVWGILAVRRCEGTCNAAGGEIVSSIAPGRLVLLAEVGSLVSTRKLDVFSVEGCRVIGRCLLVDTKMYLHVCTGVCLGRRDGR